MLSTSCPRPPCQVRPRLCHRRKDVPWLCTKSTTQPASLESSAFSMTPVNSCPFCKFLHTFYEYIRITNTIRLLIWRYPQTVNTTELVGTRTCRGAIRAVIGRDSKKGEREDREHSEMAPMIPMINVQRTRSYILRLPLFTRCITAIIIALWVVSLQSAWDVRQWGSLIPKEIGLQTSTYCPSSVRRMLYDQGGVLT